MVDHFGRSKKKWKRDDEDEQFIAFDLVAQEAHPLFIVADPADDVAKLARHQPRRADIGEAQSDSRSPEEPYRNLVLPRSDAGQVLQAGQAVVAA